MFEREQTSYQCATEMANQPKSHLLLQMCVRMVQNQRNRGLSDSQIIYNMAELVAKELTHRLSQKEGLAFLKSLVKNFKWINDKRVSFFDGLKKFIIIYGKPLAFKKKSKNATYRGSQTELQKKQIQPRQRPKSQKIGERRVNNSPEKAELMGRSLCKSRKCKSKGTVMKAYKPKPKKKGGKKKL